MCHQNRMAFIDNYNPISSNNYTLFFHVFPLFLLTFFTKDAIIFIAFANGSVAQLDRACAF